MLNIPKIKIGLVTVSRDCFEIGLSKRRRDKVFGECTKLDVDIVKITTIIENELDVIKALEELKNSDINAIVVYLGNFGPEGPETLFAQKVNMPCMFVAASEENENTLFNDRGDAFCGLLNASYNLALRNLKVYIPSYPVGYPDEIAKMIADFAIIATAMIGIKKLKIITFGPRPQDFLACNAPIKPLYDLGIEVMENSELDLYQSYLEHEGDERISEKVKEMEEDLGKGNKHPAVLNKLARYELTLEDWYKDNLGDSTYGVFANKCWPSFQSMFGFVPCYVNGRLAAKGIPVACETDIYGALSEYIMQCVTNQPVTLLDINNTVPKDMFDKYIKDKTDYKLTDLFMGFHCGNGSSCILKNPQMKHQLIMHRALEPGKEPNITRGTLEGTIISGETTMFRLQSTASGRLVSYMADGMVLDVNPNSFGTIGVFAIKEMGRFYRYALIEKNYPHHSAVGFKKSSKYLYEIMKLIGVSDIEYNRDVNNLYQSENPFR